jgi:L-threonylcarbamoyladenylate synthase
MKTIVLKIDEEHIDYKKIISAGAVIKAGGLVAFPTETVYGLGGDALNSTSSTKIYSAKGRPSDNPLIVHIAKIEDLDKIADEISEAAYQLADAFWPGPLTMVFRKKEIVPKETTGGLDTVAVRMPSHKVAIAFINEAGGYVAAPSANVSGKPSPTLASHVIADMDGKIDMIIDSGAVEIGLESTIIDMSELEKAPMILRPGYITKKMLEEVVGAIDIDPAIGTCENVAVSEYEKSEKLTPKAPGMKYKHYAPRGELVIVKGAMEKVITYINTQSEAKGRDGKKVGVIATEETCTRYLVDVVKNVGARDDEEAIARHLYAVLREFDDLDVDFIYSEEFETPRIGQAIMNRLIRAAGHQFVGV